MTTPLTATSGEQTLHAALELSKNSGLLAIQFPGRDNSSLHPIRGGDTSGLMTKLDAVTRGYQRSSSDSFRMPSWMLRRAPRKDPTFLILFEVDVERRPLAVGRETAFQLEPWTLIILEPSKLEPLTGVSVFEHQRTWAFVAHGIQQTPHREH